MKIRLALALGVTLPVLALAAPGSAPAAAPSESIYTRVLTALQSKGTLDPCEFTPSQLESVERAFGTSGGQYFGDYIQAIQTALSTRAAGACAPGGGAGGRAGANGAAAGGSPAGGSGGPPLPQIPLTAASGAGVPAPLIVMAVLAIALALLSAATALVRRAGLDPAWAAAGRHSLSEAALRLAGGWEDFADWLRSGRRDRVGGGADRAPAGAPRDHPGPGAGADDRRNLSG